MSRFRQKRKYKMKVIFSVMLWDFCGLCAAEFLKEECFYIEISELDFETLFKQRIRTNLDAF